VRKVYIIKIALQASRENVPYYRNPFGFRRRLSSVVRRCPLTRAAKQKICSVGLIVKALVVKAGR
jgi:hypothetical protein